MAECRDITRSAGPPSRVPALTREQFILHLNERPIEGANGVKFQVHKPTIHLQSRGRCASGQSPAIPNNLGFQWLMPGFECPPAASLAVLVLLQSKTIGDPINSTIREIRKHSLNAITKDDFCANSVALCKPVASRRRDHRFAGGFPQYRTAIAHSFE